MVAVQNQVNVRRGRKRFHSPSSAFGDYGLLPPSQETPCDRYKLRISLPVSPVTLGIGIVVIILLVAGVALGCYVYRMGQTFNLATGTIKRVTEKPLSGCHCLFSRMRKTHQTCYVSMYHTMTKDYQGHAGSPRSRNSPSTDDKNLEGCFPGPSTSPQIRETPRQEGAGRLFCITGARDRSRSRELQGHSVLETYFQKLSEKAISPHPATPGSVGYELFTPIDFLIQPNEQKTVLIDLAVMPPEGYYAQLMFKLGLTVLYRLEVKAGVIDPELHWQHRSGPEK